MSDSFITLPDGTKLRGFTGTVSGNVVSWEAQSFVDPTTGNILRIAVDGANYRLGVESLTRGGAKGATVEADITSTSIDADHQALDVAVKNTIATAEARSANATTSSKPASDVDQELFAANPARLSGSIYNNSTTATLLVRFNAAATGALFKVSLAPLAAPFFFTHTGSIHGIWTGTIAGLAQLSEEFV